MTKYNIADSILKSLKKKLNSDFLYFQNKNIVYIDYPVHNNIGDHLIYWGALEALRLNNNRIIAKFCINNYSVEKIRKLVKQNDAIIICHGGGNFGDLYDQHQNLRIDVVNHFSDCQIVMFPQSIFYQSKLVEKKQLPLFVKPNVHIHVRDNDSFDLLNEYGINAYKTPDCAHALLGTFGVKESRLQAKGTLLFRRRDAEAVQATEKDSAGFDWEDIISKTEFYVFAIIKRISKYKKFSRLTAVLFDWYSNRLISKAVSHFSRFESIDTDRLHGFILAILVGMPVSHEDNSYGKIRKYKQTWLNEQ